MINAPSIASLRSAYPERLQENAPMARFTSARVGGPADALLTVSSSDELAAVAMKLWQEDIPYIILGGGSNILVSDAGIRGFVVLNRAKKTVFTVPQDAAQEPSVWVESGANFGALARQAAVRGLAGLEWAVGIPGTVGGAVVGNAGAHGAEMVNNLILAEILHRNRVKLHNIPAESKEIWTINQLGYQYRSSVIKSQPGKIVVLAARLRLQKSTPQLVQAKIDQYGEYRRRTQPPGASMGSIFKNPPGDYAGRLVEAAGLKGVQIGGAQISPIHANFIINNAAAKAADIAELIKLAQQAVFETSGIKLETEIELVGEW